MNAAKKFRKGVARVLREVQRGHQIQVTAGYVEGTGARVILHAGTKGVMMGVREARHLVDIYSTPEAVAGGLGPLRDSIKEAADICDAKMAVPFDAKAAGLQ